MCTVNIGDTVEVKFPYEANKECLGKIGKVINVTKFSNNNYDVAVFFDTGRYIVNFKEEELLRIVNKEYYANKKKSKSFISKIIDLLSGEGFNI